MDKEVKVRISTDESAGVAGVNRFKSALTGLESHSGGIVSQIKTHWLGISAAIGTAMYGIKKAWDLAEIAASYLENMQQLDALARKYDTTSTTIVSRIREIGDGMISMSTASQVGLSSLTRNINPEKLYGLAEASTVLNDSMKMTVDQAFVSMSKALEANKQKSLKLAIGTIDLKDRYGDLADKMTEAEKQTAFYNLIMEKTHEIQSRVGNQAKSYADHMESLKVTVSNLKIEMGIGLIRIGLGTMGLFQSLSAAALKLSQGLFVVVQGYYAAREALAFTDEGKKYAAGKGAEWKANANAAGEAAKDLMGKGKNNFSAMFASMEDMVKAQGKASAGFDNTSNSVSKADKAMESLLKQWRDVEKELNAKIESGGMDELYKDLVQNQLEADKLAEKFGKIPGATNLIKKAHGAADMSDITDAFGRAMESSDKWIDDQIEKDIKAKKERGEAARDLYRDMTGYEEDYYNESLKLIEDQADRYRALSLDELAIVKYVEEEKRKAQLQLNRTTDKGTFSGGFAEGFKDYNKSLGNYFTQGEEMAKSSAAAMRDGFQNIFFDGMTGKLKSFQDYWKAFTDSILQAFSKMLADMLAKWILNQAAMRGNSLLSTGVSFVSSLVGGFSSGSSGGTPSGMNSLDSYNMGGSTAGYASYFHSGGIVGESYAPKRMLPAYAFAGAPRLHNGLMADEFPAILQKGERVIPKGKGGGGSNININIPISADVGSKKMISELRSGIEETVVKIIKRHS